MDRIKYFFNPVSKGVHASEMFRCWQWCWRQPTKPNEIFNPSFIAITFSHADEALLAPFFHVEVKLFVTATTTISHRESVKVMGLSIALPGESPVREGQAKAPLPGIV